MRGLLFALAVALSWAFAASAQPSHLRSELAGVAFLVGDWSGGRGTVADTGQTAKGSSVITAELGGALLLRRDHTQLFDADGKPAGGFDQIMMIYPEDGALRADYSDGSHVIHYGAAVVTAGRSVVFTSRPKPGAPTFKLSYELTSPGVLAVSFSMAPPGSKEFHPVASGVLTKGG